jgi:Ner family transcriptional regulator
MKVALKQHSHTSATPADIDPQTGDWRREFIKYRLQTAGWHLTDIGPALGIGYQAATDALRQKVHRSRRVERKIAEILGVTPEEIWPSRYAPRPSGAERRTHTRRASNGETIRTPRHTG